MKNIKKIIVATVLVTMLIVSAVLLTACSNTAKGNGLLKIIDFKLTDEEYGFGVKKGNNELLNQVNAALTELKAAGTVQTIIDKYLGDEKVTGGYENPKLDSSKNQLVVATNAEFAPFEYKEGSRFLGIDIEIMNAIADKLGKELVIKDIDFDSVVLEVNSGGADIAAAGLTINNARKETIDFTDTYYEDDNVPGQVLVVNENNTMFDECKSKDDVIKVIKELEGKKAGYQAGTTSEDFMKDFKNIEGLSKANANIAVTDMVNGNLDFVVVDQLTAKEIVKNMSKEK